MSGIFVSYRRDDSAGYAGRLADDLSEHFGAERVFMDVQALKAGEDYVESIERSIGSCAVLLLVIGRRWLTAADANDRRRLDDPNDLHLLEITAALERRVRVIPVLVDGARMPRAEDLPLSLVSLSRRQAFEIDDARWRYDLRQLTDLIEAELGRQELERLYAEARELHHAGRWRAALDTLARLHVIAPAYPDPDGLLESAEQALGDEQAERRRAGRPIVEHAAPSGRPEARGAVQWDVAGAVALGWFVGAAVAEAAYLIPRLHLGPLMLSVGWCVGAAFGGLATEVAIAGVAVLRGRGVAVAGLAMAAAALVDAMVYTWFRTRLGSDFVAVGRLIQESTRALRLGSIEPSDVLAVPSGMLCAAVGGLIVASLATPGGRSLSGTLLLVVALAAPFGAALGVVTQYVVQYQLVWTNKDVAAAVRFAAWLLIAVFLVGREIVQAPARRAAVAPPDRDPRPI